MLFNAMKYIIPETDILTIRCAQILADSLIGATNEELIEGEPIDFD